MKQVRDHQEQPITVGDVLAVLILLASMVLLGAVIGCEWTGAL